jgi:hypothetical protein
LSVGIYSDGITTYWRSVAIDQAGYYQTYGVSRLTSLEFFAKAENESLQAAVESYTKLITYVDEHPEYTYLEVLKYAGVYSPTEEDFYLSLKTALSA